jgi:hypothetical protein
MRRADADQLFGPSRRVEVILAAVNGDTPVFANGFPDTGKRELASVSISEVVKSAPIYSGTPA